MREILKDSHNMVVGYTQDEGNTISLFNHQGKKLGWYNKSSNQTFSASGAYKGSGNILTTLLTN
jgi:hypothetical protein